MTHPNEPAPSASFAPIPIAAAVIADAKGCILLVRKRSSFFFMQPGGKREEGETALQTLARANCTRNSAALCCRLSFWESFALRPPMNPRILDRLHGSPVQEIIPT